MKWSVLLSRGDVDMRFCVPATLSKQIRFQKYTCWMCILCSFLKSLEHQRIICIACNVYCFFFLLETRRKYQLKMVSAMHQQINNDYWAIGNREFNTVKSVMITFKYPSWQKSNILCKLLPRRPTIYHCSVPKESSFVNVMLIIHSY